MPEDKNIDTDAPIYEQENLELIFSASDNLKNEVSKSLTDNSEMIFKMLNMSILLAGIYVTLLIFIHNPQQGGNIPILWSEILAGTFLMMAIVRAITELSPAPAKPIIYPRELYKLIHKKREESLKLIIPTYLSATNKIWIRSEEKSFSRQQIIIFISGYIVNLVLFATYCIFRNYEIYLNILSIIFSIANIMFLIWFIKDRRIKLNKLNDRLENGNRDQVN